MPVFSHIKVEEVLGKLLVNEKTTFFSLDLNSWFSDNTLGSSYRRIGRTLVYLQFNKEVRQYTVFMILISSLQSDRQGTRTGNEPSNGGWMRKEEGYRL